MQVADDTGDILPESANMADGRCYQEGGGFRQPAVVFIESAFVMSCSGLSDSGIGSVLPEQAIRPVFFRKKQLRFLLPDITVSSNGA